MSEPTGESADQVEAMAALWVARRHGTGDAGARQTEFEAWLAAATSHRIAYLRMQHGWQRAAALAGPAAALPPPVPSPRLAPPPMHAPTRTPFASLWRPGPGAWRLAAAVLLAVGVGLAGWMRLGSGAPTAYATAVGSRQEVALPDGSRLLLNTDTRLSARVAAHERHVWMEQGEAFFDVAHDATRPFVIEAADRRITVLGTRFSVRRDGDAVTVVVLEGSVRMESDRAASSAPVVAVRDDTLLASSRQVVKVSRSATETTDALSWRTGKVVFDQTTLADAAVQFNRYSERKLVLADSAVAQMRIGGRFDLDNMSAFVRLLHRGFGIETRELGTEIILSSHGGGK